MYKILIVDDEKIYSRGAKQVLSDNFPNLTIFVAENGLEALGIIESDSIDGMLLDIRMPKMDGVELLKTLKQKGIHIKTIILSGFDDFEYMKSALDYGAVDYLLKPIVPKDLISTYKKLVAEVEREKKLNQDFERAKAHMTVHHEQLKEKFFQDVVQKEMTDEEFIERVKLLKLNILSKDYCIAVLEISEYHIFETQEKKQLINICVKEYLDDELKGIDGVELFQSNSSQFILMFYKKHMVEDYEIKLIERIKGAIENEFRINTLAGMGQWKTGCQKIGQSFFEAVNGVKYASASGNTDVVDMAKVKGIATAGDYIDENVFQINLKLGNQDEVVEMVNAAFAEFENTKKEAWDANLFNLFCLKLMVLTMEVLREINVDCGSMGGNQTEMIMRVLNSTSYQEQKEIVLGWIDQVMQATNKNRMMRHKIIVEKAKNIINQKFVSPIGVKDIADEMGLNPNYLGHVFKGNTQMSINDYVNQVRVNKAKSLLKNSDLLIYQIADRVGFNDPQYFSTVFKKLVGISPKEYKEL